MRRSAAIFFLFALCFILPERSAATHIYGGDIYYEAISPGVFTARFTGYFAAGAGIIPSTSVTFNLRSAGCSAGITFQGALQGTHTINVNGMGNCNPAPFNAVIEANYSATFSIPTTQPQCTEWVLSVQECSKYVVANIPVSQNACLYVEARINQYTLAVEKNSPVFLPPFLVYEVNKPATYSNYAVQRSYEPDSMVYTLKPALNNYNTPLSYAANMSYLQPLPTSSGATLHPNTGTLTFTPNVFQPVANGVNAYSIVIEVAAFRKINGVVQNIGTSQRNLPVFIVNSSPNNNPDIINATANGQPIQPNTIIGVIPGDSVTFQFQTADADAGDILTVIWPIGQFLGSPFPSSGNINLGSPPRGSFTFHTFAGTADKIYYFPVTVMDNACPVRGITTRVYGLKLLPANPLGISNMVHAGPGFTAFPNPFTQEVSFKIPAISKEGSILIYNLLGQQIDQIPVPELNTSEQHLPWKNAAKHASGTYIARLVAKDKTIQTLKFTKLQ